MVLILRLAIRNLLRHFRRSAITILSIGMSLGIILWLQAILAGSNKNVIDTITSTQLGHLQIIRNDYKTDQLIQQSFAYDSLPLNNFEADVNWAPRLLLPGLVSSGEQSMPVGIQGIDPQREAHITRLREALTTGEFLSPEDESVDCKTRPVLIGSVLAKLLNVELGNKIVVLAQAKDGTLGNELLRVKGIFDSGSPEFDKSVVFTSLSCVRLIGSLSGAHEVVMKLKGELDENAIKQKIAQILPQQLGVWTWREAQPRLAAMVTFNDASLILVSVMLFSVISLGILNTLLIGIMERTTEFGVMMALGMSPARVVALVLLESFLMGVTACLMGLVFAAAAITYHKFFGFDTRILVGENLSVGVFKLKLIVYPVISWFGGFKATVITLTVVLASALYPALRAARLRPIDAIRSH